jgi:hypothetical protein
MIQLTEQEHADLLSRAQRCDIAEALVERSIRLANAARGVAKAYRQCRGMGEEMRRLENELEGKA